MKKTSLLQYGLLVLLALLGSYFGYRQLFRYLNPTLQLEAPELLRISRGMNAKRLAHLLEAQKLIKHKQLAIWFCRLSSNDCSLKSGTYKLVPPITLEGLLKLISSGQEAQFPILFPEGSTFREWELRLKEASYLSENGVEAFRIQFFEQADTALSTNGPEGWLFPDTYYYTEGTSAQTILEQAHQRMQTWLETIWEGRDPGLPLQSKYELLIMASVIEKETHIPEERKLVASVIVNRLRSGMRLQMDSTVSYGRSNARSGELTKSDLLAMTPFNTYLSAGLPPAPIGMPSLASLEAAAHPEKTPYLYFVANGEGRHVFSENLKDHNQAVAVYRRYLQQKRNTISDPISVP